MFKYYDYSQYTYLIEYTELNRLLLEKNEALAIKIAEEQKLIEDSIDLLKPMSDAKYKAILNYSVKISATYLFFVAVILIALSTKN